MNIRFIPFGKSKMSNKDMAKFIFKNYYKTAYHTAYKHSILWPRRRLRSLFLKLLLILSN